MAPGSLSACDLRAPRSRHRRWRAIGARGQRRVPAADDARVAEHRASELDRGRVWIWAGADHVPVEDELAERRIPLRRRELRVGESFPGWMRVGIERRLAVARIAR